MSCWSHTSSASHGEFDLQAWEDQSIAGITFTRDTAILQSTEVLNSCSLAYLSLNTPLKFLRVHKYIWNNFFYLDLGWLLIEVLTVIAQFHSSLKLKILYSVYILLFNVGRQLSMIEVSNFILRILFFFLAIRAAELVWRNHQVSITGHQETATV